MQQRFLFITRNYPPKVGGLEVYSYNLIREFEHHHQTHKITLTRSNRHLIWFFPFCLLKGLLICRKHHIAHIHLCDALLSPIGMILKKLTRARISVSVVGLDITYPNRFYQMLVPRCVRQMDRVICISRATRDECKLRGILPSRCAVIPIGINPNDAYLPLAKKDLLAELEVITRTPIRNQQILVTVGRLVKRKGVAWFVEHVMPRLDSRYLYLIVGAGPEKDRIRKLIRRYQLESQVLMLGQRSDSDRNIIFNAADMFIMPNITVPGDVEGFGIVALEAGSCGLPVVASNIQGIRDAVLDGQTGMLVEERNVNDYLRAITKIDFKKEQIRTTVKATFDWSRIYDQYLDLLTTAARD